MLRLPTLAPVAARLRRAGHVPAVLLADLPARLTGAPPPLTGHVIADNLDRALAASLARLGYASATTDDRVERVKRPVATATRPDRSARPGAPSEPTGRTVVDLPGRAVGRGT